MKKNTHKKEGMSAGKVIAVGASVAALAAASYYFFGPEGKKNRKTIKGWMIKMKGEIIDKMEDAQEVTEAIYHQIVDSVAESYLKGGKAGSAEVVAFADILKKQWRGIAKTTSGAKKKISPAKKTVTKAVKKAVKPARPHKGSGAGGKAAPKKAAKRAATKK